MEGYNEVTKLTDYAIKTPDSLYMFIPDELREFAKHVWVEAAATTSDETMAALDARNVLYLFGQWWREFGE